MTSADVQAPVETGPEFLAPRVIAVEPVPGPSLRVVFETGDVRTFDARPLLDRGVFCALSDASAFAAVSVVPGGGGVEWASGADLSANRLFTGGRAVGHESASG